MITLTLAAVLVSGALPRPTESDLARAEKSVTDIWGGNIDAAKKPAQRSALAKELLSAARKLADDPAGKFVVLKKARELAVGAKDPATAVKAVEGLAQYEPAERVDRPLEKGHELWKSAKGLEGKLDAAEWYFRAVPELEGLQKKLVEKRLEDLGYSSAYLSQGEVVKLFGLDNTWKYQDGSFKGTVGNALSDSGWKMHYFPQPLDTASFSFQIKGERDLGIRIDIDKTKVLVISGAFTNTKTLICVHGITDPSRNKTEHREGGMDASKWHTFSCRVARGSVTVEFDGSTVGTFDSLEKSEDNKSYKVGVGFGSHEAEMKVRNVALEPIK